MALLVNGVQVAGNGKSAYLYALAGGYSGTEEEFCSALASLDNVDSRLYSLIFTYNTETSKWSCNKTYEEITEALENNKFIYAIATGKDYGYTIYTTTSGTGNSIGGIDFINLSFAGGTSANTPSGTTKTYGGIKFSKITLNSSNNLIESDTEKISVPYNYSIVLNTSQWNSSTKTLKYKGFWQISTDERAQMIIVAPAVSSREVYQNAHVQVINQENGYLTFGCDTIPAENLTVYVTIQEVTQL